MFNLYLNNYRAFLNQNFKFSKINIIIGENSAGKSSLLKFLLAMKQSFENPAELNLKLSGEYADLGNFNETVYYKKSRIPITFGFEFDNKYFDYFINFFVDREEDVTERDIDKLRKKLLSHIEGYYDTTTKVKFALSSRLNDHSTIKTVIENEGLGNLEIIQKKGGKLIEPFYYCDLKFDFGESHGILENVSFSKDAFLSLVNMELRSTCAKRYKKKGEEIFYKLAFLLITQNYLRSQIDSIVYVNPINTNPKRFYFQEDKKNSYTHNNIDKFVNLMSDNSSKSKRIDGRLSALNTLINDFGLAQEIRLVENESLPVIGLEVRIKDLWSNITDVGYGVSLQLPILFEALMAEVYGGQTILIEQPEVHLHPALQAKFIESLISIGNKNSYFIETHSEHIIRKLQILIKSKVIKSDDITIHYFKRGNQKFNLSVHEINEHGMLIPSFPSGFYDVSYSLVKELL